MVKSMDKKYTDKDYWEQYWNEEIRKETEFYFDELIDKYISWKDINSYMEIGGAPGSVMTHMYKIHGLSVSTVDFTESERIIEFLNVHGVEKYSVFQSDFMKFDIVPHCKKYDIVASWGFIEHFERKVAAKFIEKQKQMVSEKGYLVIELPNIRKVFWLVYWIFNRELIKIHNLEIMDLSWLKKCVTKDGKFELLYASYYFTMNPQNEFFVEHKRIGRICKWIVCFFGRRSFSDHVKKWFFPYIIIIARRKKGLF